MIAKGEGRRPGTQSVRRRAGRREGNPYHLYPFQTRSALPVFGSDADGGYDPTQLLQLGNAGGDAVRHVARHARARTAQACSTPTSTATSPSRSSSTASRRTSLTGPWNMPDVQTRRHQRRHRPDARPPATSGPAVRRREGLLHLAPRAKNRVAANDFLVNYLGHRGRAGLELYKAGGRPPALTAAAETASSDPIVAGFGDVGAERRPDAGHPRDGLGLGGLGQSPRLDHHQGPGPTRPPTGRRWRPTSGRKIKGESAPVLTFRRRRSRRASGPGGRDAARPDPASPPAAPKDCRQPCQIRTPHDQTPHVADRRRSRA